MKKTIILASVCLKILSACADQETTKSGFLKHYDTMQMTDKNTLKYTDENRQGHYSAFMIDKVHYTQGNKGEELEAEQISKLKAAYKAALIKAFSEKYTLTNTPAAGVMRVRVAVTGVSKSIAPLNYVTTLAIFTPVSNGGISTEGEITDSISGQRLSALSTHTNPDITDGEFFGYFTQTGHARSVLENHAIQLRETL